MDDIEATQAFSQKGKYICPVVQQVATLWLGAMRVTGGAINPDESFWWLIYFPWNSRLVHGGFRATSPMATVFQL